MDWGTLLKIISDQGCPQDSFHICCSINTKEDQIRDQGSGISPGLFPEFLIPVNERRPDQGSGIRDFPRTFP